MPTYDRHNRTSISSVDTTLKERNKVHEMAAAERCFASKHYAECASICYKILHTEPSEAIRARCHMYLAIETVGPEKATGRA